MRGTEGRLFTVQGFLCSVLARQVQYQKGDPAKVRYPAPNKERKGSSRPGSDTPSQQALRDRGRRQEGLLGGMDESLETMRDEQSKGYEDTPREQVSSPEIDPRFGTGSEQSLFN